MKDSVTLPIDGRNIHKTFPLRTGEVVRALDGVSLQARHGTLTALVGPDGAGKTTLIRLVAGLIAPDSGSLRVLGIDVTATPQTVQERIGCMPQKFGLYEDLSVQENLDLYADLHGISADERRRQYPRLLDMTALRPFTRRLAGQLSGGMKQKLGLACTLVRSPELVLLDEPTVGVDPLSRRELWDIILSLVSNEGLTVLLGTSYLDEAERCGHVIVLHAGRVLAQGAPEEITAGAGKDHSLLIGRRDAPRAGCRLGSWKSPALSTPSRRLAACASCVPQAPQATSAAHFSPTPRITRGTPYEHLDRSAPRWRGTIARQAAARFGADSQGELRGRA
jgi:ABC-2 type transport system ATP-binding protein